MQRIFIILLNNEFIFSENHINSQDDAGAHSGPENLKNSRQKNS